MRSWGAFINRCCGYHLRFQSNHEGMSTAHGISCQVHLTTSGLRNAIGWFGPSIVGLPSGTCNLQFDAMTAH